MNAIHRWSSNPIPKRAVFISDLHLMSTRSTAEQHRDQIGSLIQRNEIVVWGGDLFDFRWSSFSTESEAVDYSLAYLQQWRKEFPHQQFVFLCGNHDASPVFLNELRQWIQGDANFVFAGDVLRIGDTVMLHGDQIEGRGTIHRFENYRQRWADKKRAAMWRFAGYDAIVAARAHKVAAAVAHSNKTAIKKLNRFLTLQELTHETGVRQVVFGHTHRLIRGVQHNRMHFFNGGAAIRHVPFRPVEIELDSID
ncbi:metallophosphoesterase [Novipirellula galeiformis]|nr:metallophosphoesterase [Novipirellula galeiformis]